MNTVENVHVYIYSSFQRYSFHRVQGIYKRNIHSGLLTDLPCTAALSVSYQKQNSSSTAMSF